REPHELDGDLAVQGRVATFPHFAHAAPGQRHRLQFVTFVQCPAVLHARQVTVPPPGSSCGHRTLGQPTTLALPLGGSGGGATPWVCTDVAVPGPGGSVEWPRSRWGQ